MMRDMDRCPKCGTVTERQFFGGPGDGRNFERNCPTCPWHGLIGECVGIEKAIILIEARLETYIKLNEGLRSALSATRKVD